MKNSLIIALNDLRVFFASRENLFGLVLLPIFFTVLVGGAANGGGTDTPRIRVDLLDLDQSTASAQLIEALRGANSTLYFCPADAAAETFDCNIGDGQTLTVATSIERVTTQTTNALIVIPAGYGVALQAFEPVAIEYYSLSDMMSGDIVFTALDAAVQAVNSAVVAARAGVRIGENFDGDHASIFTDEADQNAFAQSVYTRAVALLADTPLTVVYEELDVTPENRSTVSTQGYGQSVPGMGAMFVMFTVLGGLMTLVKERKQWTLQRLVMMPLSRSEIIGGKIINYFTQGIIQYGVVFLVGIALGVDFGRSPLAIFLVAAAFVLCVTALALALATVIKTEQQANGISFLLSMTLAPLGGAWWPLEITPPVMQALGRLSPVSWAMDGFREVIFYGGGVGDVLVPIGVLLAASVVLFGIGVARFRYE